MHVGVSISPDERSKGLGTSIKGSTNSSSRLEALEAKVNQLLDVGGSSAQREESISPEASSSRKQSTSNVHQSIEIQVSQSPASGESYSSRYRQLSERSPEPDPLNTGLVSSETATHLIEIYRTSLAPHFPFVVLSPSASIDELRIESPCLFLSILTAAAFNDLALQRSLGEMTRRTFGARSILGGETSFDLLQGILVSTLR